MSKRTEKGKKSEDIAASFLEGQGLKVICRNFRAKRGELDIIARDKDTLCIVEVRSRGESSPRVPEGELGRKKVRSITRAARKLIHKHGLQNVPVRYDLLVVYWESEKPKIKFYPGGITPGPVF